MKLVRLIKMCQNKTYSRARVGKHLSDMFSIKNGLKEGDALSPLFFNFVLECANTSVQVNQDDLQLNGKHQVWFLLLMLIYWEEEYVLQRKTQTLQ